MSEEKGDSSYLGLRTTKHHPTQLVCPSREVFLFKACLPQRGRNFNWYGLPSDGLTSFAQFCETGGTCQVCKPQDVYHDSKRGCSSENSTKWWPMQDGVRVVKPSLTPFLLQREPAHASSENTVT